MGKGGEQGRGHLRECAGTVEGIERRPALEQVRAGKPGQRALDFVPPGVTVRNSTAF
jgi:hypothetical protein